MGLKSEAREANFREYIAIIMSFLSMAVCVITCIISFVCDANDKYYCMKTFFIIVIVLFLLYSNMFIKKYKCVNKWRGYMLTALEEIEKEKGY